MKKLVLLLALLPLFVSAQDYAPLVKEGGIWRKTNNQLVNPPNQFILTKHQFTIIGDTIIRNTNYKKMYSTDYDSLTNNLIYMAAIREDSMHRVYVLFSPNNPIVYNHNYNDSAETLIYDFSLNVGDTFFVSASPESIHIVNTIDSILVSGLWRKRISFIQNGISLRIWIEGIGDTKGLFFPLMIEFESYRLLTCYEDSQIFWTNPLLVQNGIDCFSVGIPEVGGDTKAPFVRVYPNPTSSTLNFEFEQAINESSIISIYNTLGQKVKEVVIYKSQNSFFVNLNEFENGIYFYQISSRNRDMLRGKFIKQ